MVPQVLLLCVFMCYFNQYSPPYFLINYHSTVPEDPDIIEINIDYISLYFGKLNIKLLC